MRLLSAGAYTSCYSTVGFNGFEPLPTVLQARLTCRTSTAPPGARHRRRTPSAPLALALPWPLLLVLVAEHTDDPWLLGLAGGARMLPYVALLVARRPAGRRDATRPDRPR